MQRAVLYACNQRIQLGNSIRNLNLKPAANYKKINDTTYVVHCPDSLVMMIGTGEYSQLYVLDDADFIFNKDSVVKTLTGAWVTNKKKQINDLVKSKYELEQVLGDPSSIRPISWKHNNYELNIGSISFEFADMIYVEASID